MSPEIGAKNTQSYDGVQYRKTVTLGVYELIAIVVGMALLSVVVGALLTRRLTQPNQTMQGQQVTDMAVQVPLGVKDLPHPDDMAVSLSVAMDLSSAARYIPISPAQKKSVRTLESKPKPETFGIRDPFGGPASAK